MEQSLVLLQDGRSAPRVNTVLIDLGYRGLDADIALVQPEHSGKSETVASGQRRGLKHWQAIEPIGGHVK